MSELKGQLEYLKSVFPETAAPKLPSKAKETFLFETKTAAQLPTEHIFAIGVDGLMELINIDNRFRQFHDSLFNSKTLSMSREQQTLDVNKELDENIAQFLLLLSPYFLLTAAHKVTEFLIRRYKYVIVEQTVSANSLSPCCAHVGFTCTMWILL